MAANGEDLVKRYDRLRGDRANFDERWERMAPFIAPSRMGITTQYAPGEKQTHGVYDSTTLMAAELIQASNGLVIDYVTHACAPVAT